MQRGLRAVAMLEALKGFIVVAAGFGLLSLLHHDVRQVAVSLVTRLHIPSDGHYAGIFIDAASAITDKRLWALAALAFCYSALRFAEAYGLWRSRRWGVWLGAIGGAIYVPVELYELWHKPSWIKLGTLTINVVIVIYLVVDLMRSSRSSRKEALQR